MALENPFDLSDDAPAMQPSLMPSTPILMQQPVVPQGVEIASANPTQEEMQAYIKQAAAARGIDPGVALKVAHGEGGFSDPFQHGLGPAPKSQDPSLGAKENSYGPYQLYISGKGKGLGDAALAAGVDPRKDWRKGVDFALDHAKQNGWGEWYGAKAAGITGKMGIGGTPVGPAPSPGVPDGPKGQESYPAPEPAATPPSTDASAGGVDPASKTQLMKMMLAASLANVRLQPVDYDPYKVMPHISY